jgi:molybdopterin synthase catalytic subunit
MRRVAIVHGPIDVAGLLAQARDPACGAVALFMGTVRAHNDGRAVKGIEYRAYEAMAEAELSRIVTEAAERHAVEHLLVQHRIGDLVVGDVSVAIVAADAHRGPALRAMEQVIEELKRRVPIWKRELYADGTREWIDPTAPSSRRVITPSHALP